MPSFPPKSFFNARQTISSRRSSFLILIFVLFFGIILFLIPFQSNDRCINRNPRSVRVLWDHGTGGRNAVVEDRHKVMAFVGIQTGFGSVGRRQSLRKTWFPSEPDGLQRYVANHEATVYHRISAAKSVVTAVGFAHNATVSNVQIHQNLEEATGLAFRFVIGRTNDRSKMSVLKREIAEYDDFIQLDIEEEYSKLPYKTLAFFKAAYALFEAEFYVKADDDIYLRPDRLSLLLAKERSHSQTYIGCMKKGPVFTDPKLKWYEPLSNLLGKEYFLHAYGPIYALSADVVSSLVALRNNSFRMFSNEDVTIGAWMLAMNVKHENIHELCAPACTSTSIAVWDIPKCSGLCNPEQKMLELHRMDSCIQSPTMLSDD